MYRPNAHLVEGYVREDGKVLTRRGDGAGAILEFIDPLPPTKLGQLKGDVVNRDLPSTPKELREAAVKSFVAKDDITREFAAESREDFVAKVDEAQRRKDGGVPDEQLPIFDEFGHKTLRRETGRGYRSVDGGRTLIPKDRAGPALEEGAAPAADGAAAGSNAAAAASSSSFSAAAAQSMADDAEQQAAMEALRRRRKSRSKGLFNNISSMDDDEYTRIAQPLTLHTQTGQQSFVRHEGNPDDTPSAADQARRFDPFQHMVNTREAAAAARKEAANARPVWADEVLEGPDGKKQQQPFRGDPLSAQLRGPLSSAAAAVGRSSDPSVDAASAAPTAAEAANHAYFGYGSNGPSATRTGGTLYNQNEAGDEQITAAAASADAKMKLDLAQYRKDLDELDYYVGSPTYDADRKSVV